MPQGYKTKTNLYKILHDNPIVYYWIGFLFADGSINIKNKSLKLAISEKDSEHLIKFCEYFGLNYSYEKYRNSFDTISRNVRTDVMDKEIITLLINKFDFKKSKTYNPPNNLKIQNDDLFTSFLIGYIDGDGSIGY